MKNTLNQVVINVQNITKVYPLNQDKPTLVEYVFARSTKMTHNALRDVSIQVHKGEIIGVAGPNGSGKSTLLKIIAGITKPTKGTVFTRGRIVSIISLNAGFHPELSGFENIILNGLLLGMSKDEIYCKRNAIIRFAGIGKFIYSPLYTYSQGMRLRLGFSVAIHSDPDILLFDEILSVGDADFQMKCGKKIKSLFKKGKTVLMISHVIRFLQGYCNRCLILENGKIIRQGPPSILSDYEHP